jgi:hypothetical protein
MMLTCHATPQNKPLLIQMLLQLQGHFSSHYTDVGFRAILFDYIAEVISRANDAFATAKHLIEAA